MGGALHRLQVLIVGLILLLSGTIVVALIYLRPPAQGAYLVITPVPVAGTDGQVMPLPTQSTSAAQAAPRPSAPTPAERPQVLPAPAVPLLGFWASLGLALSRLSPLLLALLGAAGLLIASWRMVRRTRMAYTGQSVRMLLVAADPRTRAANRRVLRELHAQGQLPEELASAAGISARRWTVLPRLPALHRPAVSMPRLHRPVLRVPSVWRRLARRAPAFVPRLDFTPLPALPVDEQGRSILIDPLAIDVALPASEEIAEIQETAGVATAEGARDGGWSAEDRVLAVAGALATLWQERGLASRVTALDTSSRGGPGHVSVTIDPAPAEEEALLTLPDALAAQRGWQVRWTRQGGAALLVIKLDGSGAPPSRGPWLAPLLAHGRNHRTLRFFPLQTWRHLGLYGAGALEALHVVLTSLLYAQAPRELALAILDAGQVSPLYAGVAHAVAPPGDVSYALAALTQALRRGGHVEHVRPLLLVVVEPDEEALAALSQLLARLRQRGDAPLHLILVQERLQESGREFYAMLPALVSGPGQGNPAWLPGQHDWPQQGMARLAGRGVRLEGRALHVSEAEVFAVLGPLRREARDLPPVLWDNRAQRTPSLTSGVAPPPVTLDASRVETVDAGGSVEGTPDESANDGLPAPDTAAARDVPAAEVLPVEDAGAPVPLHPVWPRGPHDVDSAGIQALFARIAASPAITAGAKPGLTRNRLRALLPPEQRSLANQLYVWFDAAGLLADPSRPDLRWREPRALHSHEPAWIAVRLAATPIPAADDVATSQEGETRDVT